MPQVGLEDAPADARALEPRYARCAAPGQPGCLHPQIDFTTWPAGKAHVIRRAA
nr:Hypothetical protein [Pseudomonas aeruginosa]